MLVAESEKVTKRDLSYVEYDRFKVEFDHPAICRH